MINNLTAVILTLNEELHLERCLQNVKRLTTNILIVDSGSLDKTSDIAHKFDVNFVHNQWPGNHSKQVNFAINHELVNSEWIIRIDADEVLSDSLIDEIEAKLMDVPITTNGFYLKRRNIFLEKQLRHGGMHSTKILRLWRRGYGECNSNIMDEKIVLKNGNTETLDNLFFDHNLNSIQSWCEKHIDYAYKEALQSLARSFSSKGISKKVNYYYKLPIFLRPFLYFFYRYFVRLGFLDGKQGLIWHFLQGLWYRMLVDINIFIFYLKNQDIESLIKAKYPQLIE